MNPLLKKVKDLTAEGCVTLILNTHRTRPDNERDPINLKNQVSEAERRLLAAFDKRFVWEIMAHLNEVVAQIDHQQNLESLIVFANADFADYTRLPIAVQDRVVIDQTFATRDLVRAAHQEAAYYVLVLSRRQARLIEAFNDKVVQEVKGDFPLTDYLYTTVKVEQTTQKEDRLIEEFFNRVDKVVWETIKDNPLPVLVATEGRNYEHFLKVTDQKSALLGTINRNRDDEAPHHIVSDAWAAVQGLVQARQAARLQELGQAIGQKRLLTDWQEMWEAIQQGRGQTIFVEKNFFQPARWVEGQLALLDSSADSQPGMIDDLVDEMIEENLRFGGDTVFVAAGATDLFAQVALVTRY